MKGYLQIDVSKTKRQQEEDLIAIRFQNEEVFQVHFYKLVHQSKYIRDKYKYSEAINSIQWEIEEIIQKYNIKEESIKFFIQLIQDEKITLPIEHYKDIYTLSEYFCVPTITAELDNIREEELFNDLDFTIQHLLDYEAANDRIETKLLTKIENFLIVRINECMKKSKFGELPISTICRILEESEGQFDQDQLFEFILESAETRFIMFKFIEIEQLNPTKVSEMIEFLESQEEPTRKMYLEYMPISLSLIKSHQILQNKYDQLFKEMEQTKKTHNQTVQELEKCKRESNQTKTKYEEIKQELEKCKRELNQTKDVSNERKSDNKQYTQSIIVGGYDYSNELGEKPNNIIESGSPIISPPVKSPLDPSSLLSYSVNGRHSVLVMSDGSLKGIGENVDGRISSTLQGTEIKDFTDFCIKDGSGRQLAAVSAVCSNYSTLYMFSKIGGSGRHLVLCDRFINGGDPIFLDIGNHQPVSLFGFYYHSAAICSEGEVIFINHDSFINSPNSPIAAVSLPNGEKASSVACSKDTVVVLSSNGRVFSSPIESNGVLRFSIVSELSDQEIVCVSGTCRHFLAVSKEGRVFGRGLNEGGQLGLGEGTFSVSSFTKISSLFGYEIRAAYAGCGHSLFETREGKVLSCGRNNSGQLLLSSGPCEKVYSPTETTITSGASFCIAGDYFSVVFIGCGAPPNTPNMRIRQS